MGDRSGKRELMVKGESGKGTRWRGGVRGRGQRTDGRPREARRPRLALRTSALVLVPQPLAT